MSIEKLKEESLKWVEANKSKRFSGVTKLLTDLYPDNAHFIYELLQNAEDARDKSVANSSGASVVRFILSEDTLEFEHNGEGLFTLEDVGRITGIGDSAKGDDPTNIGKFGIGFKAVFAYTSTPEIHSGEFHFRIHDLVVPEPNGVKQLIMGDCKTRFIFPFDNPKKNSKQALAEIEQGLRALGDNTLLFLSHIRKIEYLLPDGSLGALERIDHEGGRIEIRASHPGGNDTITQWLRYQKDVEVEDEDCNLKTCRIAIAFSLIEEEDKKKRSSKWKIIPLDHGQVSIYFPADKETSNLRFHLHAPFASTVARDSVRDCKANHELRDHIAELVVESLASIREQGMLTVSLLAVLPNPADNLSDFYESIRKSIVQAFESHPLTPMKQGGHAATSGIFRGPARISDIVDDEALVLLLDDDYDPPMWVANPPQQNQREDRFIESLEIDEWGWSELTSAISYLDDEKRKRIEKWIAQKDDAWLMRFYGLLGEACDVHDETVDVNSLCIVRVEGDHGVSEHVIANEAFFHPDEGTTPPPDIRIVKPTVYSVGRAEERKKFAYSFLEKAGVRPFDAKAMIERRISNYKSPPNKVEPSHYKDLKQFISFWKKNPIETRLFSGHTFLLGVSHDGELHWLKPHQLCLDTPYLKTGLAELTKIHGKNAIWDGYQKELKETQLKDFATFLIAIGVMHEMKVELEDTSGNPHSSELRHDYNRYGIKWTYTGIDEDYSISQIYKYLASQSVAASRLIWDALIRADAKSAMARFRPNQQYPIREAPSKLVCHLKRNAWIPDKSGDFWKPSEMTKDALRADFVPDERNRLLTAIGFGENANKRSEEYKVRDQSAKENGFDSAEELDKWRKVKQAGISPDEILAQFAQRAEQPVESVKNPERRRKGVLERKENAPAKESVTRERSIQPGVTEVVAEAKAYLRAKYKNPEGQLICQCCHYEMPFKIRDTHYFEAIQCLRSIDQHHFENRLALCPTCAAMYQHARETDDKDIQQAIVQHDADDTADCVEISVKLARRDFQLRFVGTHWFDLKTILSK